MGMDPNGPAAKAGFKVQDILIEIDGKPVTDRRNVLDIVTELRPGTEATMKVLRNGKPTTLKVQIGDEPSGY
ncbi:outer membrane stress sensor protease DegS [Photobacterium aphoticum]|nr:outer membrane stress sensor protease DegS [Photobacterium aphoticum]